ncbi:cytochrome c oxidase assembly protein [Chitinasiproducens palmae]|uniref:Putative membrane protein n=1 Tax=Chitinasiproducens palmae TaxID=1770053 RepID=A0A1H2PKE8_9BURK|nr:cytochrome c oxidase assembly protein [Chitinasiproducens palmae]SDV46463.1 putative membrane protein [Chitinasiproducens palmae]
MQWLSFFVPWEPSAPLVLVIALAGWLFARGARRHCIKAGRHVAFWSGLLLFYVLLHTHLDYYAEHQFFMHRLQHLGLHHLAPLLLMAAFPAEVLRGGLPLRWRRMTRTVGRHPLWKRTTAVTMNPFLVTILFIVAVLFWLVPSVQFVSMLDWRIYHAMNWSVAVTGLMYWALILDHRPSPPARMRPGGRVMSPIVTMVPQILAGAVITFTERDLYPIFDLCGRAFFLTPLFDQSLGGLIMWVPAAGFEALGTLIALRHLMRLSQTPRARQRVSRFRPAGPVAR